MTNFGEIYNKGFYEGQADESYNSGKTILQTLASEIKFDSVIDVGCGVGAWLKAAKELGVKDICGVDGDYVLPEQLWISVDQFSGQDLNLPICMSRKFDLAISVEVAEHLPAQRAENFIADLCGLSDMVLFSAAIPFQGGHNHVNENWLEYWSLYFSKLGFVASDFLREKLWNDNTVKYWYRQNIVLFCRESVVDGLAPNLTFLNQARSVVHPEHYLRSIRRGPKNGMTHSLKFDLDYLNSIGANDDNPNPEYGSEFDYRAPIYSEFNSLSDVRSADRSLLPNVLIDAVATVEHEKQVPATSKTQVGRGSDFLVIGGSTWATNWAMRFFENHNQTWMPLIRQVNYFNQIYFDPKSTFSGSFRYKNAENRLRTVLARKESPDPELVSAVAKFVRYKVDDNWYREIFNNGPAKALKGDLTSDYFYLPKRGIQHVFDMNPDCKVIILIANPVTRCVSQVDEILKAAPLKEPLVEKLAFSPSILIRGLISEPLKRWESVFPAEQIHICLFDDLEIHRDEIATSISDFLGLSRMEAPPVSSQNTSTPNFCNLKSSEIIVQKLTEHFADEITWLEQRFGSIEHRPMH